MMKTILILLFLISANACFAQQDIPDWFIEHMSYSIGQWVTSNSDYKNEDEPYDQYLIEWIWGIGKKSTVGRLSGLINGQSVSDLWEYRQYWDPDSAKPVILQFGKSGMIGKGELNKLENEDLELQQVFTNVNKNKEVVGHRITKIDSSNYVGASFVVVENNKWEKIREYVWTKIK